ncbi:MAG TPA: Rieske 2Fe-2S domain-containing protein [Ktedonobacteraceae bacterium]|nr:Rieske 2Fe-2S domain-containing protein [Ktedonobacteraceae bacterium]
MTTEMIPGEQKSWSETPPSNPPIRFAIASVVENQTWLDSLATPLQNWLLKLFGQPEDPNRVVKNILNGTWLGHALHPVLTDIPIGAWSCTVVLDIASFSAESNGIAQGADIAMALGVLGATGAAVTGLTDWSDLDGTDRRVGLMHGLLNSGILLTNVGSLVLRLTGRRRAGITLSTIGYLASLFSAYLGGELSFAKGIGVNHDAWEGGSDDYVPVMNMEDLEEGKLTRVDAAGIPAVLYKQGGTIYAIGAVCTHLAGPLDEGTCENGEVTCPWHGSRFRMSDGAVVNGPAVYAQPTFAVRVHNGKIELRRLDHA